MPLRVSRSVRVAGDFEMEPSLIVYLSICVIPGVRSGTAFAFSPHVPLISRKRNSAHLNLRLIPFRLPTVAVQLCWFCPFLLRSALGFSCLMPDLQPPYNG